MNILPRDKQVEAVAALCEGVSVRATERLTGVNRGTILPLAVRVGQGCAVLHDRLMRDLNVSRIELDEAWSYVAKKQARLTPGDGTDKGDQYVFLAVAGAAKAILSYCVGKRNQGTRRPSSPGYDRACSALQRSHRIAGIAIPAQLRMLSAST